MGNVRVIQVIESTQLRRGSGMDGDPSRNILQYFSLDGTLLWEVDPFLTNHAT